MSVRNVLQVGEDHFRGNIRGAELERRHLKGHRVVVYWHLGF